MAPPAAISSLSAGLRWRSADVVVVGAGLAGLDGRLELAEAGASVEVVARGTPRLIGPRAASTLPRRPAPQPGRGHRDAARGPRPSLALVADDLAVAADRLRGWLGTEGCVRRRDLEPEPARPDGDRRRPTGRDPAERPGGGTRRVVARRTARHPRVPRLQGLLARSDRGEPHSARRLGTRRRRGWWTRFRPERVESLAIELPGLAGRHNVTALTIAGLFDDPSPGASRSTRLPRPSSGPGTVPDGSASRRRRPQGPRRGVRELAAAIELTPFEIPLVPPSIPGLRLFDALRSALRARGGRIRSASRSRR